MFFALRFASRGWRLTAVGPRVAAYRVRPAGGDAAKLSASSAKQPRFMEQPQPDLDTGSSTKRGRRARPAAAAERPRVRSSELRCGPLKRLKAAQFGWAASLLFSNPRTLASQRGITNQWHLRQDPGCPGVMASAFFAVDSRPPTILLASASTNDGFYVHTRQASQARAATILNDIF